MRKSRFTEEQIITALKEHAARTPAKELCRRLGVGTETLYRWKHKYGGMAVSKARRLRALEDENRRLKKLVADLALDNAAGLGSVSDRTILTHIHHDPCSPGVSERWLPSILRSPREAVSRAEEASRASFVGQTLTGSRSQCLIEVAEARPNNIG